MANVKVKSAAKSTQKWRENASRASDEYREGAVAAASEWASQAGAAAPTYKAAITAGDIDRRYSGGIQKAGAAKYARGVEDKGAPRYPGGITAGEQEYASAIQHNLQVIASVDVPARKLRGDPGNRERSVRIQEALHRDRLARLGAGR